MSRSRRWIVTLNVVLLQLILTQVATFVASLFLPAMDQAMPGQSALFALILGITFTIGAFTAGWLALTRRWLNAPPRLVVRLAATLIGACTPLGIALALYRQLEPGNPFFLVSALAAAIAFHLPSWVRHS